MKNKLVLIKFSFFGILFVLCSSIDAQTEFDGLFMSKNIFCVGTTAEISSFNRYWENEFNRDNANLGTVQYNALSVMGNYGLSDRLNVIFSIPYIHSKTSAGNLSGQNGIQDASLWVKFQALNKTFLNGNVQIIGVGGFSFPASNYNADFMPLSIGRGSQNTTARLLLDYEENNWYMTVSGAFIYRSNITLDRNTYYTDRLIYSNQVEIPNQFHYNSRFGYRNDQFIADIYHEYTNTLGGFDIPKNGMPFPSNEMDFQRLGFYAKIETPVSGLSFLVNGYTVFRGKNMGQLSGIQFGAFYIIGSSSN